VTVEFVEENFDGRGIRRNDRISSATRATAVARRSLAAGVLSISAFVHFADRVCAGHLGDQRLQAQTIIYRYGTLPHERATAKKILSRHGRSSLDYFNLWPDKAHFFSASGKSFAAYRVGANFAVALADPIGPPEEMVETIGQFRRFCEDNGWGVAFHQTLPDLLPVYHKSGFKRLKIGDDAIVDLTNFTLDGKGFKKLRSRNNQLENRASARAYRHALDLPKVGVALGKVSELTE